MAYSTAQDVRLALVAGAVVDDITAAELTDSQINDAVAEADARIDGYLAARYQLPIPVSPPPPALLKFISRDIAAYLITLTWLGTYDMDETHHPVALRMKQALRDLDMIRDGKIVLPLPPPDSEQTTNDPWVSNLYDGVMFTRCDFDLHAFPNDCDC